MELHPAVAHLAPLLGTWRGGGRGDYPTIEAFDYTEEVTIGHAGKPFLAYSQRTKSADGSPLHAECGYWRPDGDRGLEMLVVHPSGIGEMLVGEVTETHYGLLLVLRAGAGGPGLGRGGDGAGTAGEPVPGTGGDAAGTTGEPDSRTGGDGAGTAGEPEPGTGGDGAGTAGEPVPGAGGDRARARAGTAGEPVPGAGGDGAGTAETGTAVRAGSGGRVILAPTAKRVDATERRISVDHAIMRYEVHMAAVGEPMTPHLEATLHRVD